MADGLVDSFLQVHDGLLAVSQAHEAQDEESPDDRKQMGHFASKVCRHSRSHCPTGIGGNGWVSSAVWRWPLPVTSPFLSVFSSDRAAQVRAVQVACAFGQLAVLVTHWLGDVPPGLSTARLGEELRQEVEKLGGYLQVFLQVSRFADCRLQDASVQYVLTLSCLRLPESEL